MQAFTSSDEKCSRCGACVAVCPLGLIKREENQAPRLDPAHRDECLVCGHCVAVCPSDAWSSTGAHEQRWPAALSPSEELRRNLEMSIKSRRSVREFRDEPVPDALIGSLIETARYAPTAGNAQGVSWLVLRGRETVRRVAEIAAEWLRAERDRLPPSPMKARFAALSQEWENGDDVIFRGAPALVVTHADERQAVALLDCTLALGYLDLLAWAAGLGTCWGGFGYLATLGWPALREHLALPPQHKVMGMMMLGYPQYRYRRIPERDQATITWRA